FKVLVDQFAVARVRELAPDYEEQWRLRSRVRLLVLVRLHAEPISPFIYTAGRNGDRVFGAHEIAAKLSVTEIAQHGSLVETGSRGNFCRFEQLLDCHEAMN